MRDVFVSSIAGCVATVPMTWTMELLHRYLPQRERYPLPPREITMKVAEEAGLEDDLDEQERLRLTLLAHFGMGSAAGALYEPLTSNLPLPALLRGAAYGLAVWGGNYLGLLPALGILTPATRHPPRRTALMIAAHLVWGMSLALLATDQTKE